MLPFLEFLLILAVIISVAKVGGYISSRFGQPAVAGEVFAGVLLGPTLFNFLNWDVFNPDNIDLLTESITFMAELGVLLLLFIAGIELEIREMSKAGKAAFLAGFLGFLVPLGMGYGFARIVGMDSVEGIFIGLLLSPTSVSISAQTLMELKVLRSKVGMSLLGAAVIDDTLVVLGLSVFLALIGVSGVQGGSELGIGLLLLRMAVYLLLAGAIGYFLIPRLTHYIENLPISQGVVAFAFVMLLAFSWTAEVLGHMAMIIGAFIAGISFSRTRAKKQIEHSFSTMAYTIFVPIFFINVGLQANLRNINMNNLLFLIGFVVIAILSKLIGSGLGGRLGGLTNRESLQLGASMIPRGEVVLIVAAVGIVENFITQAELSVAVATVVITTVLTPPVLRILFSSNKKMV